MHCVSEMGGRAALPPGVLLEGDMLNYAAFTMLYHDGTIENLFTEEGRPHHGSDTWLTWKSLKITKDL